MLPIRSIDFYYPEFQAANVRMFRDKFPTGFLEPTCSNRFRNLLNLFYNVLSLRPASPLIDAGGAPCRWKAQMSLSWFTDWHKEFYRFIYTIDIVLFTKISTQYH
jgi:hypothetical protein